MDQIDRVSQRLSEMGETWASLARFLGTTDQRVGNWRSAKRRKIPGSAQLGVSKFIGRSIDWIVTGDDQPHDEDAPPSPEKAGRPQGQPGNVGPGPDTRGLVPLISWVQAGTWGDAEDHYVPGDGETFLPCPASHGLHTYALRVEGDSMTAQYGKSYPSGCIIYVDPDQAGGVVSGDRVIAKINGDNKVTFKVFVEDAGRRFLKPLNPQHPVITDPFRVIGKVIGKWEDE